MDVFVLKSEYFIIEISFKFLIKIKELKINLRINILMMNEE